MNASDNMIYKACMFDLYDTLVYIDRTAYEKKNQKMASLAGVKVDDFVSTWKSLVVPSNLGLYPRTQDRVAKTLKLLGLSPDETIINAIALEEHKVLRESSLLYDDCENTLATLHKNHLKLCIVTNASPSVWNVIQDSKLSIWMDEIVVSSEVGVRKPEARIYEEAIRRLGVIPQQCIFIGDGNDCELEGAKAVGLTTVLIQRGSFRPVINEQSSPISVDFTIKNLNELLYILGLVCEQKNKRNKFRKKYK